MTRKLIFIRHAKAEDQVSGMSDFERSLTKRGKQHSRLIAEIMRSRENDPGVIVSSPAFRALETALIFCREYGISADTVVIRTDLYTDLDREEYIPFINSVGSDTSVITFFGHNPLISEMASWFAAEETDGLPKTGVLCLSFEADSWSEIEPRSGTTGYFLSPKSSI
jgi:phosphohistidine phosphatase